MKHATALPALALASALALTGCAGDGEQTTGSAAGSASPTAAAGATTGTAAAGASESASPPGSAEAISEEHDDADVMFAQMMIPHHRQAVQMSDIMLAKDDLDPRIRELAEQIKAAQGPEIERMDAMLETWGEKPVTESGSGGTDHGSMDHGSGSGMSGMLIQEDLEQLEAASGDEAARLFLTGMIEHHRGAVDMAEEEISDGRNPQAVELAQQVVEDQEAEIQQMEQMLRDLPGRS